MNPAPAMNKTIVLAGGTGLIGRLLATHFLGDGYAVTVLTRGRDRSANGITYRHWDPDQPTGLRDVLEGAHAVVGLNGASVDSRYTAARQWKILHSRIASTLALGDALRQCTDPPRIWIQLGTATIYRHAEDRPMDQFTGDYGSGFSVEVARSWEAVAEAGARQLQRTRLVLLRSAMVLDMRGGVLPRLAALTRAGLGGRNGSGEQFVSWIHGEDLVRAVQFIMDRPEAAGVYDLAAPEPVRDRMLMEALRAHLRPWIHFPKPRWMLEIGAFLMRTETELILKSRRVVPARLRREGFVFRFPSITPALVDLLAGEKGLGPVAKDLSYT
jgi:uncharacterized protein